MRARKRGPPPDELDDIALMQEAKTGRLEAFAVLVGRHQHFLLNYFRRLGVYHEAEDLTQETFVRVYTNRLRYRPDAKFTTYLYRVARHRWIDWLRKQTRKQDLMRELENEPMADLLTPEPSALARVDTQAALASLPVKLRETIVLCIFQGLKYAEISEVLEIPVGTVKSRIHQAMEQLKEYMHVRNRTF